MKRDLPQMVRRLIWIALGACMLSGHAFATGPAWIAGPSLTAVSAKTAFKGGGFNPAQNVKVYVKDAAGLESVIEMQASDNGTLSVELTPTASGMYSVTVRDVSGTELAKTRFISQ